MSHIKTYSLQKAIERIDDDLNNKNKLECVYFIREGSDDIFKVGYADNVNKRLETLQVGNSKTLSVYKTIIVPESEFGSNSESDSDSESDSVLKCSLHNFLKYLKN